MLTILRLLVIAGTCLLGGNQAHERVPEFRTP